LWETIITADAREPWVQEGTEGNRLSYRHRFLLALFLFLVVVPLNLLILPIVTVAPPFKTVVKGLLKRVSKCYARPGSLEARRGFSVSLMVYWKHLFILPLPVVKFFITCLTHLALAACLSALPPPDTPPPDSEHSVQTWALAMIAALSDATAQAVTGGGVAWPVWPPLPEVGWQQTAAVLLVWLSAALYAELKELWTSWSLWFADYLNLIELPSFVFSIIALAVPLVTKIGEFADEAGDEPNATASGGAAEGDGAEHQRYVLSHVMLSLGVLLMWTAQGLRLIQLSPDLGPMVLMFFKMIRDVCRWLMLVAVLVLAFAAAFRTIFNVKHTQMSADDCIDVDTRMGESIAQSAYLLLEQAHDT